MFEIGSKIYYIRGHEILEGDLVGFAKKGALKVTKSNSDKYNLVNILKAFLTKEEAIIKLTKIKQNKENKENKYNKEVEKYADTLDLLFRAHKSYYRNEISKEEFFNIEKNCNKILNK